MLLQRLLNRLMNANLPVDGVMSDATRSALQTFQSQPAEPPSPPPGATPPPAGPEGGSAPQSEYDELAYLESEFDEFAY
jgi:peptidoglycan hydrolase-like protein with peptidoglycan-binding domain